MAQLKGSKTEDNLKAAFAGESQANRRYLYFSKVADVEGYTDIAGLFRDTADGETGHAHGHLDFLKQSGDPATGKPIGTTDKNLVSAIASEFGAAIHRLPDEAYLRGAWNNRKMGDLRGTFEEHDWSEILTGAYYDLLEYL